MYSKEKIHKLCKCAVENRLIYGCGDSVTWETLDPTTETIRQPQAKPWEVQTVVHQQSEYYEDEEMVIYLTKLLADNNINCP
ncbi:MAG: hypothetical protein AAFQ80_13995 [Cyanobacteria bacterium J06621_8]